MIFSGNARAVVVFNQPFTSSTTVSNYFNATAPDPTTQFNDISAEATGGTWSINGSNQLQLVRVGDGTSTNGAGFTISTPLLGPPNFLKLSFNFGMSGSTLARSNAMAIDIGGGIPIVDYDSSTASTLVFSAMTVNINSSPSRLSFTIGGTTSGYYTADGTMYAITYYLNGSGSTQSYTAPDGTTQSIDNGHVSLWVGTTQVFANVAKTGTNANLNSLRCHFGLSDSCTWKFGNFVIDNGLTNNGITGKIVLDSSNIIAEEAHGYANLLLDEQAKANDPANGLGGTPSSVWNPGTVTWFYPAHAIIDLGGTYNLTNISVFNGTTSDTFTIDSGSPFNWSGSPIVTDPMTSTNRWVNHAVSVQTRYLHVTLNSANSAPPEIVVYGSIVGSPVTPPTPVTVTPPNIEDFMGVDTLFNAPVNGLSAFGFAREYHHWSWDEGDGVTGYPGYPNNQDAFNPNGFWWNFDQFYINMQNLMMWAFPCYQGSCAWINGSTTAKPLYSGASSTTPASYAAHADHMFQAAARYGAVAVSPTLLKLNPNNAALSGMNVLHYYENWNEHDAWWGTSAGYFNPYEYSAMSSADCDGHMGTMGTTVGVKNADSNARLAMSGLAVPDLDYIKAMKYWSDYYRSGSFPVDAINIHIYANNGTGLYQSSPTTGISPEAFGLMQKVQAFRTYRDQYLPGKEVWVTEFGYDTNPGSSQAAPAIGTFSNEEVQGQWIVRSYLALAAAGVDRAVMFTIGDNNHSSTARYDTSGALHDASSLMSPKPSWYYVAAMKNRLTGLHYYGQQSSGNPNVMIYQFADGNNNIKAYAVWCPTSNQTSVSNYQLTLQGAQTQATLITLTNGYINGVASSLTISSNTVTVDVSERPIFVLVGPVAPEVVPDQKITLTTSMVTNESGMGNAGMLVDEQTLAGDPDNTANAGGIPTTGWHPSSNGSLYPFSAYIDLGQTTQLSKVYLYDANSNGPFTVSIGSPGSWTPVLTDGLWAFDLWDPYVMQPGTQTRYVRLTMQTVNSGMTEVVLYQKMPQAPWIYNVPVSATTTTGSGYTFAYYGTGSPPPTFSVTSGSLPPGLTLSSSGVISGTATTGGIYSGVVTASNGVGTAVTQTFSITVNQAPAITNGPAPSSATVGTAYSFTYTASGYPVPTFTVASGSLPPGLTLSSVGAISGTPTTGGTYTGTVSAGNGIGSAATQSFSIVVTVPTFFSQNFSSSGTVSAYVNASSPNSGQFNDISAEVDGGTWSIVSSRLDLLRTGASGANNGAGFTRFTFSSPPNLIDYSFTLALSGVNTYEDLGSLDVGNISAVTDYNNSTSAVNVGNRLTFKGGGSNVFFFYVTNSSGTSVNTGNYSANGTDVSVSWIINQSGSTQTYHRLDGGGTQSLPTGCSDLWINNTLVLNNIARSTGYGSSNLGGMRFRTAIDKTVEFKLGNFNVYNTLP